MKKWEYLECREGPGQSVDLNFYGIDGWELVQVVQLVYDNQIYCYYYFRRELK